VAPAIARDDALEAMALQPLQGLGHLARVVAAETDEHRNLARRPRHGARDHFVELLVVECRRLAGRAEREQHVDAERQVVVDQPVVTREIDGAILERRDEGQPQATDHGILL
jgi:hypothetical protein